MSRDGTEDAMRLDRHTLAVVKRSVKRKGRKARFPTHIAGIPVVYCNRCLRGSHEVKGMVSDYYFTICHECVDNLAIFVGHLRNAEKQGKT